MLKSPHGEVPPISLGMTSVVLGSIGCLLFFLPILGIPIGVAGFLFAVAGMLLGRWRPGARRLAWVKTVDMLTREDWRLRRSILGWLVSTVAIVNGFILGYAPLGYVPTSAVQPLWQAPPGRVFVPPPALPGRAYQPALAKPAEKQASEPVRAD